MGWGFRTGCARCTGTALGCLQHGPLKEKFLTSGAAVAGRSCAAFLTRPFAKMHGDGGGAMPRQEAQELDCLSVEPAASLGAEDEKAASLGAAEFEVQ